MIGDQLRARTRQFALDVIELSTRLGETDEGRLIRPQLFRAGTGVAANHRSACRSRSGKEFVARISVAIDEADESELWLDLLEARRCGPPDLVRRLKQEALELLKILSACRTTAASNLEKRVK